MTEETGYAPKLHRPATMDHLRKKEPREKTVEIVLTESAVKAFEMAEERLSNATTDEEKAAAQAALDDARRELDEATVTMSFRSIGRKGYDALLDAHQPTEEQKAEEGGSELIWNPDTFPVALIAASSVEPKMTEEDVQEIYDEWNSNEVSPLFFAALEVNTTRRTTNLGKGYGVTTG